jgi:hypothetical protein
MTDLIERLERAEGQIGSTKTTCYELADEARLSNLEEAVREITAVLLTALRAKEADNG